MRFLLTVALFSCLIGCATIPKTEHAKKTILELSGHQKVADAIEKIIDNGGVVRLALSTNFSAIWNPEWPEENRKSDSRSAITNYETITTIQFRDYFVGNSSFSIIDIKALTPIERANYILLTDIEYAVTARYWGKLIDVKNEHTISNFYCVLIEQDNVINCH